ncbi:GNAT family acetyltransferase [Prescottella equi]|uniref:putative acetyltransferase n=1 Tax=Rhodococcus hoagii TaxID=43767 RepID=UPI000A10425B|nr:GNAT family acetyltransferase [Prescottella equi]MBM4728132.1 GNAT family acetyltransferase [Prescottella equi]NKR27335.1 GNAT family acetyltransferase [Prescottella equi]NKR44904.1 GNAT family acetyltransferase [Prescottella equi]NKR59603.1 GNAT family acetyltransferase [Prescottella equi]NKR67161.1 GNAT family acetyltransferase [Prescottella equi]
MTSREPGPPVIGGRVVVRYRLPPGGSHPLTDVIGTLEQFEPTVVVRTADDRVVEIERADVVRLKALGPKPVRRSDGRVR